MEDKKLVIQYVWGSGKKRKEIFQSELNEFLEKNAINEMAYEIIEIVE